MRSNLNKVLRGLILSSTIALSSNLGAVELQLDAPKQEGYYYFPPRELKLWENLSPEEQKAAEMVGFDRKKFSDYLLKRQSAQNETNTTNTKK